jgi:allophanate hydrolase
VPEGGTAIEVEVWEMPSLESGSFIASIPSPLALGKVELANGAWVTGFVCEFYGLESAADITEFGGWRAWLASAHV